MNDNTEYLPAEPGTTPSSAGQTARRCSKEHSIVEFPFRQRSAIREMQRLGVNLCDLASAVHASFLATFTTIPQSLLAAAAELIADRRQQELTANWCETLRLYIEALDAGTVVIDIIARTRGAPWLGRATVNSIQRIRAVVVGAFLEVDIRVSSGDELSAAFGRLQAETEYFMDFLAELRRRTGGCAEEPLQTTSTP